MPIEVRQIHTHFVGEVSGVDLSKPISSEDAAIIEDAINQHGVLIFRDQNITDEQQASFSRHFGKLEVPGLKTNITKAKDRRLSKFMADISNLDRAHNILDGDSRPLATMIWLARSATSADHSRRPSFGSRA